MERHVNWNVYNGLWRAAGGEANVAEQEDPRPKLDELVEAAEKGDNRRVALWCKSGKRAAPRSRPVVESPQELYQRLMENQWRQMINQPMVATASAMSGAWPGYSTGSIRIDSTNPF